MNIHEAQHIQLERLAACARFAVAAALFPDDTLDPDDVGAGHLLWGTISAPRGHFYVHRSGGSNQRYGIGFYVPAGEDRAEYRHVVDPCGGAQLPAVIGIFLDRLRAALGVPVLKAGGRAEVTETFCFETGLVFGPPVILDVIATAEDGKVMIRSPTGNEGLAPARCLRPLPASDSDA